MHFYEFQQWEICWKTVPDLGCGEQMQMSEDARVETGVGTEAEVVAFAGS